jgi:flavin-dependent dehydrogenase
MSIDVLIVGAGPAGSSAAIHLSRAGHRVVAVDRAVFPRDKPCSEYLSPETVRLLDRVGLVHDLEQAGAQPLYGTKVVAPRGSSLVGRFAQTTVPPFRSAGLAVSRRILDQHLVEGARRAGAEVRERTTVEALLYERGAVAGAVVREQSGARRVIRARLTIGADGLRSVVARRLGRRYHGLPARLAFVAHVADVPLDSGIAELHVGDAGYAGLNLIAGGLANVALVVPRRRALESRGDASGFFFSTVNGFPGVRGRVRADRMVRPVLVTGPFAAWSGRVVADGALLIGDAADFFDPFTGQGIHAALRGGELAAAAASEALASPGPVTARRLAGYRSARRRAFLGKWAVERLVGFGMLAPTLFDHAVARLEHHGLGHTWVGVAGDYVPASTVFNPKFLCRMVL